MNYRFVLRQLGLLLTMMSVALTLVGCWSLYDYYRGDAHELEATRALGLTVLFGLALAWVFWQIGRRGDDMLGRREALLVVALSWLGGAALAGLPYWIWALMHPSPIDEAPQVDHAFTSFAACYFEAMSGLTTTGATVLDNTGSVPKSLLLWRATTHWLGGLGIVVLFVAVLPSLGVGGKKLYQFEAPGPQKSGMRPRIRETARALWLIYLGMTLAEIVLLRLWGMTWFNAVCHTFATLATGGFSTRNESIAAFPGLGIQITIMVFMVLAGVNFGLYYQMLRRSFRNVWHDAELRLYLLILLVASIVVVGFLIEEAIIIPGAAASEPSVGAAIKHGIFQVISIQTTTGFITADFDQWTFFPKAVLFTLMFVGASAGSTGGGIKVIRILIAFKIIIAEIERVFRPNLVKTIKVGRSTLTPELRQSTLAYILSILVLFVLGALLLMLLESGNPHMSFQTAASASAATLNNIGPGFGLVGAVRNYSWFSAPSLVVMSLLMALGRLEMFAILVLFVPRFWRGE